MGVKNNITVIIPVRNELIHVERCVKNALRLTNNVFVVDSSSTDGTAEKARSLGAQVFNYEWDQSSNFSKKMNWTFDNLPIDTEWVIRLDADEYFLDEALDSLADKLENLDSTINAATLNRRLHFQGRWIKYGAQYPRPVVRVTRLGRAKYESKWLDEGVIVENNSIVNLSLDIVDDSLISISKWIEKHNNNYASKEAIEIISQEIDLFGRTSESDFVGEDTRRAQRQKKYYYRMPLFWRAFLYFNFRYFIQLGFLDGYQGFLWNFFQAWWYRTLIDVKVLEIRKACGEDREKIKCYIAKHYKIRLE